MTRPAIDEALIRETAYLFWLDEGQPEGRDREHWMRAIDVLTPVPPKAKPARKTPAKPRATKAKAASKAEPEAPSKAAAKPAVKPAAKPATRPRKPRAAKASRPATT